MAGTVYLLCAATSVICAGLLIRGFLRTRTRLLLWSSLCFIGLAASNALLVVDRLVVPTVDLSVWRLVPGVAGLVALIYGLVMEAE